MLDYSVRHTLSNDNRTFTYVHFTNQALALMLVYKALHNQVTVITSKLWIQITYKHILSFNIVNLFVKYSYITIITGRQ